MPAKLRYLYRAYRYRYRVDRAELGFLRESLRPGQVAIDVGCHKGAYTYWMRRCVGASGRVIAVEPQPQQVAYLRHVFESLAYTNVDLLPVALSDSVGQATLHVPTGTGRTHAASLEVRRPGGTSTINEPANLNTPNTPYRVSTTTLDTLFVERSHGVHFLKIDVEGHELAVLRGGLQTLAKHHPAILLECETRHRPDGDVHVVFNLLLSLGYEGTFFHNGRRVPLSDFDPAIHQRVEPNSDRLPRGYVNNFAFVARG